MMTWLKAAALSLALLASPALAEPPDLSGFWNLARQQKAPDADLMAKLPPNTVLLADTGVYEFPSGEYGGLKIKPDALAKAKQWKPEDEMTLQRVCAAPSLVYAIQGPFPFEIYQTPQLIIFKYEYFDQVRIVFMDGRKHLPESAPHSKTGHSVGHWEGDELVIDTTHFSPATITNNGLEHSDRIHMVERYKMSADGKTLMATQWFEDPAVLDNAGARFIQWAKHEGEHVFPYDCDPSLAVEYQQTEKLEGK
jgi:hypothetical protein